MTSSTQWKRPSAMLLILVFCLFASLNAQESLELFIQMGHTDDVKALAVSQDDRFILSGSDDNTVKLWDVETGREIRTFQGHENPIVSVGFIPDGLTCYSGSKDASIIIWDMQSGKQIRKIITPKEKYSWSDPIENALCTPDGRS